MYKEMNSPLDINIVYSYILCKCKILKLLHNIANIIQLIENTHAKNKLFTNIYKFQITI